MPDDPAARPPPDASPVGWDLDPVVAAARRRPPLTQQVTADVCVVGLGGSGLAAVGAALDRGLSVVGVDAGRVGAGAAGRNGGLLAAGPSIGVAAATRAWGAATCAELYRATLGEIDDLEERLGPSVVRRVGGVRLIGGAAGQDGTDPARFAGPDDPDAERADAAEQFRMLRELGFAVEHYTGPLGDGLYFPDDGAVNPARRALALADRYGQAARLFEDSPVTAIGAGRVRTPAGSVSAGLIVVAVDGRLEVLLPQLAGRVRTVRLQMLATEPLPPGLLPCPVHLRWGYDYAQQDASGRMFVGGGRDHFVDREWTADATPTVGVQRWIERQAHLLAGRPVRITHRWAASAGYTDDGRPLVTTIDDGVVACGGYSGTGNLVGPIAARAALTLGIDGVPPPAYFAG